MLQGFGKAMRRRPFLGVHSNTSPFLPCSIIFIFIFTFILLLLLLLQPAPPSTTHPLLTSSESMYTAFCASLARWEGDVEPALVCCFDTIHIKLKFDAFRGVLGMGECECGCECGRGGMTPGVDDAMTP